MAREWFIKWQMGLICLLIILTSGGVLDQLIHNEYLAAFVMLIFDVLVIEIFSIHMTLWKHDESITNDIKDMDKHINLAKMERKTRKNGRKLLAKRMSNNVVKQRIIRLYFVLVREMNE